MVNCRGGNGSRNRLLMLVIVLAVSVLTLRYLRVRDKSVSIKVKRKYRKEAYEVAMFLKDTVGWWTVRVDDVFVNHDSRVYRCHSGDVWCEVARLNGEFKVVKTWVNYPEAIGLDRE